MTGVRGNFNRADPWATVRFKEADALWGPRNVDHVFGIASVARLYAEEHGGEIVEKPSDAPSTRLVLDPPLPSVLTRLRDAIREYRALGRRKADRVEEAYRVAKRREWRRLLHKLVNETGMDAYDLRGWAASQGLDVRTYQIEQWMGRDGDGRGGARRA